MFFTILEGHGDMAVWSMELIVRRPHVPNTAFWDTDTDTDAALGVRPIRDTTNLAIKVLQFSNLRNSLNKKLTGHFGVDKIKKLTGCNQVEFLNLAIRASAIEFNSMSSQN